MLEIMSELLTPVLLGGTKTAFSLSLSLFERYRCVSVAVGDKFYWRMRFSQASSCLRTKCTYDETLCLILSDIAEKHKEDILWLIPCSKEYSDFIQRNKELLETMFVIHTERSAMSYEK